MDINFSEYKVLIVDDCKINYMIVKVILEKESLKVSLASSAQEAMVFLENHRVDLILMDVMMPEMDGFEFTKWLKSNEKYKDLPILFITALNSPEDIIKGFDLGGSDYITKPFNREELLRRVKHQIRLSHFHNTIVKQNEDLQTIIDNRDRLHAILAHDLRTPISSLKMIFSILSLKNEGDVLDGDFIRMLYAGSDIVEQLFSLLDNLLKRIKSQMGSMSLLPQIFDFDIVVESAVEVSRPAAKIKDICVQVDFQDEIDVLFDIDVMKSIVRNLLINAIKFSNSNSTIQITVRKEDNQLVFEVQDEGIGMTEAVQARLRKRMYGNSVQGTLKEDGVGLGLWIVQHFIDSHNGSFYFRSEEGKGSLFGFKMPIIHDKKNT
ncbi:hybrid sensor histidine kinase/response regulator [Sphingobacterium bovisgrunnientis]|uniref:hybrid sensor histidine kinase/response regulator n=1 Tax=Sphingobacterium bovisgrunnientis TaxID=1874697 RepID=UPI0021CF9E52|nr:hybrid sensor histidine kinase/response regulator [Sphingobacterium bovisgrunnientis]